MQKSVKHFYTEDYYKRRKYEFDSRYPFLSRIAKTLVEKFDPKSVLDVGCAKGYLVCAFRDLGVEAYGVDISEWAISESPPEVRDRLFNIDVDSDPLPFEDEAFDLVTATEVVEHLANHNQLLSEVKRVLKPEGIVFISAPRRFVDTFGWLVGVGGYGRFGHNPTHVNVHPKSFWIMTFKACGFDYMGDFPREALKESLHLSAPNSKIARFLVKFGKVGKWLRKEWAFALRSETLLFRKA